MFRTIDGSRTVLRTFATVLLAAIATGLTMARDLQARPQTKDEPKAKAQAPAQAPSRPSVDRTIPLKTVEFDAKSVGRRLKYNVYLPAGYESSTTRYPVVYLLHGYSSNYVAWNRHGAPRSAKRMGLEAILVMPDGGNSWYVNWAESESGEKNAWEDCIIKDLIPHVDATFRTIAKREGRAINGLSMGGYGALTLGLRHPDLFCAVGSQSGALEFARSYAERLRKGVANIPARKAAKNLDAKPRAEIQVPGFSSQVERTPDAVTFKTAEDADAYDPFLIVLKIPKEKLPHLCIDCGTEDVLLDSSRNFVKLLLEQKIPFTYSESPGAHVGAYWAREIPQAMAIQLGIVRRNLNP